MPPIECVKIPNPSTVITVYFIYNVTHVIIFTFSPEHLGTMICDGTIRSGMVLRGVGTGTGSSFSIHL